MSLEPTEAEIIEDAITSRLEEVYTCAPGRIHSYDAVKQVCDIELAQNRPLRLADGSVLQEVLPILPNVQVRWPRAGGYSMHLPLAKGDWVIVLFSHASLTTWRDTGGVGPVGDVRLHSLDGAFALPGVAPDGDVIAPTDAPATGEAVFNGPGHYRVGGPSADWVAHATSTSAALDALQQQITALQAEVAAVTTASTAAFAVPGPDITGARTTAFVAAPAAVVTCVAALAAQAAVLAAQKLLIPASKLKAQ